MIDEKLKTFAIPVKYVDTVTLLNHAEVASMLKISLPTLNEWSKRGIIQSYRIGSRVLYKRIHPVKYILYRKYKPYSFE